jgi:hypothetical protein
MADQCEAYMVIYVVMIWMCMSSAIQIPNFNAPSVSVGHT